MANEIRIVAYGENQASPMLQDVATDSDKAAASVDRLSESTRRTTQHSDEAGRSLKSVSERTDELDESGSHATSALGALGSGFELIGKTNVQDKLNQVALATDFMSGIGEGATLIIDKLGGALKSAGGATGALSSGLGKIKEGFADANSTAGKFTTGAIAAAASIAALTATFAVIKSQMDKQNLSATDTYKGLEQIAASGRITDDSLKGLSSNTGLLQHDLESLNGGIAQHIKNLGDWDAGMGYFQEGSSKTSARLKELDEQLTSMVNSGNGAQAAAAFKALADQAAQSGVSVKELQGGLPLYTEAVKAAGGATDDAAQSTKDFTQSLKDLNDQERGLIDPILDFADKTAAAQEAQDKYTEAVRTYGKESPQAKAALRDAARAAEDAATASIDAATASDGKLTPALKRQLQSAGWSEQQIKDLAKQLREAKRRSDEWAKTYTAKYNADIYTHVYGAVGGPAQQARDEALNRLYGIGKRTGGIQGAANGQTASGLTWTGEDGPELLDLPPGTSVHTKGDSQRMMQQIGGGVGDMHVVITFDKSGMSALAAALMETLRAEIRGEGGNVQDVLGVAGA